MQGAAPQPVESRHSTLPGVSPLPDVLDGKSMLPLLEGKADKIHNSLYFELGYTRGVLKDAWKYIALRYSPYARNMTLEQRKKLLEDWNKLAREVGMKPHNTDPTKPFSHVHTVPGGTWDNYLYSADSGRGHPAFFDADQLYNLAADPGEQKNLAADPRHASKLQEMQGELKKYLEGLPGPFAELKPAAK